MSKKMKNIAQSEVLTLREQISYQEGQIVSKTLTQNQALSITLFSFAKGEEISTHESSGDAFVTCLDGIGKITIDGVEYLLHEGESIVMPAGHPHAVYGQEAYQPANAENQGAVQEAIDSCPVSAIAWED